MQIVIEPGSAAGAVGADPNAGAAADWRSTLADAYEVKDDKGAVTSTLNFRTDPTLAKYKTPEEQLRGHIELAKVAGQGFKVPGADAKPEERAAFFDRLGRPKDATGYAEVKGPEGILPDALTAYVQNVAVARRMDPADVQASVNFLAEHQARQHRDAVQGWDNAQEGMRTEWGLNFTRNHDLAQRYSDEVLAKAGGSEEGQAQVKALFGLMDTLGLGHHPGFLRWMHFHAVNATEDVFLPGAPDAAATTAGLDAQIETAKQAYYAASQGTPEYTAAHERYMALLKRRHPETA